MKRMYSDKMAKEFAQNILSSNNRLGPGRQKFHKMCALLAGLGPNEKIIAAVIAAQTLYLDEVLRMGRRMNDLYFARLEERLERLEAQKVALEDAIKALTDHSEGLFEAIEQIGAEAGVNLSELGERFEQARAAVQKEVSATRESLGYEIEALHKEFEGGPYEEHLRTEIEETKRLAKEARDEARRAADEPHIIYY